MFLSLVLARPSSTTKGQKTEEIVEEKPVKTEKTGSDNVWFIIRGVRGYTLPEEMVVKVIANVNGDEYFYPSLVE